MRRSPPGSASRGGKKWGRLRLGMVEILERWILSLNPLIFKMLNFGPMSTSRLADKPSVDQG